MTDEEAEKWLEAKVEELTEHFEVVQILASYTDSEGTHCLKRGGGNWYARQGMAREFVDTDQAQIMAREMHGEEE